MPPSHPSHAQNSTPTDEPVKRSRFNARISEQQRAIIERAANLTGQTVSQFIVSSAQRAAEETIREHDVVALSLRDSQVVMEALLHAPVANAALRRAFERHDASIDEG